MSEPKNTMIDLANFLGLRQSVAFFDAVDSVGLTSRASAWMSEWTKEQKALVEREQCEWLERFGYLGDAVSESA